MPFVLREATSVCCILLALFLCCFAVQEIEDGGADDFGDLVGQHVGPLVVVVLLVGIEAVVQLAPDVGEAHALAFEALDLLDHDEVLQGVAALAALGALGHDDALQLLFPEAQGVAGHAGTLAHFMDGQRLHLSRERGAGSREQKQTGHGFTQIATDFFTTRSLRSLETQRSAEKNGAGSNSTRRLKPKTK